ncbi:MAG: hypothetical protein NE330_14360, partial [Lentisphaeraceae bacterium]|nr:hypothetical protein [Lentisphaeraceae bacterium]
MCRYFILFIFLISSAQADEKFQGIVGKYCLDCHGGKKTKGGVNFKGYEGIEHIYENHEVWKDAIMQVEEGEMPPED